MLFYALVSGRVSYRPQQAVCLFKDDLKVKTFSLDALVQSYKISEKTDHRVETYSKYTESLQKIVRVSHFPSMITDKFGHYMNQKLY